MLATIAKKRTCEFCGEARLYACSDTTICKVCDAALERQEKLEAARIKERAARKLCRTCKAPLTPSRYFECEACFPPEERPTEDAFEELTTPLLFKNTAHRKRPPKALVPLVAEKKCRGCTLVKAAHEFHKDVSMRDGLRSHCKVCYKQQVERRNAKEECRVLQQVS